MLVLFRLLFVQNSIFNIPKMVGIVRKNVEVKTRFVALLQ